MAAIHYYYTQMLHFLKCMFGQCVVLLAIQKSINQSNLEFYTPDQTLKSKQVVKGNAEFAEAATFSLALAPLHRPPLVWLLGDITMIRLGEVSDVTHSKTLWTFSSERLTCS